MGKYKGKQGSQTSAWQLQREKEKFWFQICKILLKNWPCLYSDRAEGLGKYIVCEGGVYGICYLFMKYCLVWYKATNLKQHFLLKLTNHCNVEVQN